MLSDREYMRGPRFSGPPVTIILIWVLVVCFLIQAVISFYARIPLHEHLGLTLAGLLHGKVWLLGTYQFLHAFPWPWHLLGNCLGLYFVGSHIEEMYGPRKLLLLVFGGGLAGAVVQAVSVMLPNHLDIPVVGASAGVLSLLAAYATAFPEKQITTFLYFIPVTVKARWLLIFFGALAFYGTLFPFDIVAHAAHLGGILFGIGAVKLGWLSEFGGPEWPSVIADRIKSWFRRKPRTQARVIPARFRPEPAAPRRDAEISDADFIAREVDPILEKIAQHGIQSLTPAEKRTLEAARQKVAKR